MDQGVAAVWAAGLAGFASAAGAAVGAGMAARGARSQTLQQNELEKVRRAEERRHQHEEWRRQNLLAFQSRLGDSIQALELFMESLRDGQPPMDDARTKLRETRGATVNGHFDLVMVCNARDLEQISGRALWHLERAHYLCDALRLDPSQAVPSGDLHEEWVERRRSLFGLYQLFAKAVAATFPVVSAA